MYGSLIDTVSKKPWKATRQTNPLWGFTKESKNMPRIVFDDESKTGTFEVEGQNNQKGSIIP